MLPISSTYDTVTGPSYVYVKHGYKQKPPYNLILPIRTEYYKTTGGKTPGVLYIGFTIGNSDSMFPNFETMIRNKAYESFVGKLGDSSSFGATFTAELKQTRALVVGTVTNLVLAARKIRRMDFAGAARDLGLPYRERTKRTVRTYRKRGKKGQIRQIIFRERVFTLPTGREVQKTMANGWLMYSYGVKPLAQDIYNGMDVLQRPLPFEKIRGIGSGSRSKSIVASGSWGNLSDSYTSKVTTRYGAWVAVENPNLWLANKMGLVNPVQWVLEGIPFSFVVDWFSNLSSVVGSLTDLAGLRIESSWTSTKMENSRSRALVYSDPKDTPHNQGWTTVAEIYHLKNGSPPPKLVFAYERFSWQRALNAISLLVGLLPRR